MLYMHKRPTSMEFLQTQYSNLTIISTTILSIIMFIIFYILSHKTQNPSKNPTNKSPNPPLAKGAWPILGHLPVISLSSTSNSTPLHKTLGSLADCYGPIFCLLLGPHRVHVVSTHELAKECFTKNDVTLSSRPNSLASQHLGFNYAMLGFTPYGPYWRELRKLVTLHLLSAHRLQQFGPIRAQEVLGFVKRIGLGLGSARGLVDLKEGFLELTLDIIVRIVVGKRYSSADVEEREEGKRWQKALEEVFYLFGVVVVGDFVPWLRWLDLGGYEKAMRRVNKELDGITQRMVDEHRERKLCGGDVNNDFMDVMISLLDDGTKLGGYEADHVIKATVFNLIAGGSDTTATTLIWTMSLLINHPNSLQKAQAELDLQIGKTRFVAESDIPNLPYLQAVVKEALRLYPPSPLSAQHLATEDCTIGGHHIEGGDLVLINFSKIQRDPRVWGPDPSMFRPERYLTTSPEYKNVDVKGQHFELLPFSSGRRGCPGATFALQVVHLALANLLHAFEFSTDGVYVDMTESPGLSNMKAGPLEVFLTPRLPRHLFE